MSNEKDTNPPSAREAETRTKEEFIADLAKEYGADQPNEFLQMLPWTEVPPEELLTPREQSVNEA